MRAVLDPLLQRQKLHYSEFFSLADAEIRYQMAVDQVEGAESWLDMWRQVEPDHPGVHDWERRIALKSGRGCAKHWQIYSSNH
ncbi:MAG: hypothetical protein R2911_43010 [Caldilineaceae bacterium]